MTLGSKQDDRRTDDKENQKVRLKPRSLRFDVIMIVKIWKIKILQVCRQENECGSWYHFEIWNPGLIKPSGSKVSFFKP